MRTIVWLCVLILALTVIWHSATAQLATVVDMPLALRSAVLGFVGGLAFSLFVAYAWIWNRLVEHDRKRDLDRVNDTHDKRRI